MEHAQLEKKARQIRATCIQMAHDSCQGHLISSLTYIDILVALYYNWLKLPIDPSLHSDRDRFILSKGHGCSPLYAVFADLGFIPKKWLLEYACEDSPLPNHPCSHALSMLESSSGSLGHGLGIATGILYGLRIKGSGSRAVVLLGDGECNEGSIWESAMFAATHHLDTLLAIVDYNGVQAVGCSDEIMGYTSLEEKFQAFGWSAKTINGNDMKEINRALDEFPFQKGKPSAIIAKTRTNISFIKNEVLWHYRVPSTDELFAALDELKEKSIHME